MKIKILYLAMVLSLVGALSVLGQLKLKGRHPDEPADYTYNERLSAKNALDTLKMIDASLQSFQRLTEASKGKLAKREITKVGNTAWDQQQLGFYNGVKAVEGTVRKQDYQIKQLEYELAQIQHEAGKISGKALDEKKAAYQRAEKEFQSFWDTLQIRD